MSDTHAEQVELVVDPLREDLPETGIYVRAKNAGRWGSHDIARLTAESLLAWLRSRGGKNEWAENTVGALLGHSNLTVKCNNDN